MYETPKRNNCAYSHHANYLPERGWWTDARRLARIRAEFNDAVAKEPLPAGAGGRAGVKEAILAEAFKPISWRRDLWAGLGPYAEEAEIARSVRDMTWLPEEAAGAEDEAWESAQAERQGADAQKYMMECEERATNFGHTEEEIEEMFEYGIKPYDEDAWVSALYT